jgi:hypothetical protein
MNTMTMPGFTAEASVYETNLQYRATSTQGGGGRNNITLAEEPCLPFSQPNQCYTNSVECFGVVLVCTNCCYDQFGRLSGDETEVCGACLGLPF